MSLQDKFENQADYDAFFDKIFEKHCRGFEDHQFRHYNEAMGCFIYSKEHYKHEMKKRGMVPRDTALRWADDYDREHPRQPYELSPKARNIINSLKLTADSNGNLKLGNRAIKALMDIGAIPKKMPDVEGFNPNKGGFKDDS